MSQAQECPGGTLSRESKAGSKETHPALSASFLSPWMVHPHLRPVCDRQYSRGPAQPVLIHCPERLGQRHTLSPRRATEGSSNPNSSFILSSCSQLLSLRSRVQGLGYQGGHGSCSHRLRAGNLQSEPHDFPSRTHRNDDAFLLLGQLSLLSEPKGAGSLSWF